MTEIFRSWVLLLSGIIVFGSICEMILPSGVYKKYIRLAIGLMLVLSLLSPFTEGDADITVEIPEYSGEYTRDATAEQSQRADILRIYKQKLCDSIKEEIGGGCEIECEVCEEENNFGSIENIRIVADREISGKIIESMCEKYGLSNDKITIEYNINGRDHGT